MTTSRARRLPGRHLRSSFARNLLAVASWELVWGFGAANVSSTIVLAFLSRLTTSNTIVGALNLTYLLALPGLLIASHLNRRLRRRRYLVAGLYAMQTSAWVGLGLIILLASSRLGSLLIYVVFAASAAVYIVNGFLVAPTYELLSTVFERRWGTAQGIQAGVNRLSGTIGGLFAAAQLAALPFPQNFGWTFLVGGLCLVVSNACVLFLVEPRPSDEGAVASQRPLLSHLSNLGALIQRDRPFRLLLLVVAALAFIQMVQSFYVVYALDRLGFAASYAGIFASVIFASSAVGGLTLGPGGDRFGHRRTLLAALVLHLLSFAFVLAARTPLEFYISLGLSGVATMGGSIAQANLAVDFAPSGEKGTYSAVLRLVMYPATAFSMLLAGFAIDRIGFVEVFAASLLLPIIGIGAAFLFQDPRIDVETNVT